MGIEPAQTARKRKIHDLTESSITSVKPKKKTTAKSQVAVAKLHCTPRQDVKASTSATKQSSGKEKTEISYGQKSEESELPENTRKAISNLGISAITSLQRQAIPALLGGKDVVIVSKSTREAMISYLAPAVTVLEKHRLKARHGTGIIVITPTRESAVEISNAAYELLHGSDHTSGIVMEGANYGAEEKKLEKGINLLVATPRRLLQHLRETTSFIIKNLKALVIHEADVCLDIGFGGELKDIIQFLPKGGRSSVVAGKQLSDSFQGLVELICRPNSVVTCLDTSKEKSANLTKSQGYVIVEADQRFLLLYSFLRKFQSKKTVVVLSSTPGSIYYSEILQTVGFPVNTVHGRQNIKTRADEISSFIQSDQGILICTEEAIRAVELPSVDWVIQFDPPRSVNDFIGRVGQVRGKAVAFIQPHENGFIDSLKAAGVSVEEFDFPKQKLLNIQSQVTKLVTKNYELNTLAKDAFRAFLQDYNNHADGSIFDATKIDLRKLGTSFGFSTPPRVEVKAVREAVVDNSRRPYGPEKHRIGNKRKA